MSASHQPPQRPAASVSDTAPAFDGPRVPMLQASALDAKPQPAQASAPVLRSDPAKRLAPKTAKQKPRHGLYASAWGVFGLLAGAYVFTLVLKQDGGPLLIARGDTDAASAAKTQADVARLQQTVGLLETDVARIKIDQAQVDEREKKMAQRVASVETRVEQFSGQLVQAPAPAAKVAKTQPPAAPAQAATPPAARLATGALPTQPTPAPEQQDASGLLLARGPSLDALRLSWSLLNERHKGTLKSFEPRVVEVEPGSYQLIAGPVANPAEALKVCAALKSRGVACQAADFKGSAL